jgi:hypothetical protein
MMLLTSSLIRTQAHINRLIWAAMIGIFLCGVMGATFVISVLGFQISTVDRIAEHTMSVRGASLIVFTIAVWIFRASLGKRYLLLLMSLPVLLSFFANQRRAAFIGLILAVALLILLLYREQRTAFFIVAPMLALAGTVYLAAFWNASGALAQPARAIKSVIAPEQVSQRDSSSSDYRVLENINILYTVRTAPLTGVGFGQKFYIIIPMADISFFVWWEYITHNSIMWIWLKTGLGGFLAMLFLVGRALSVGMQTMWHSPAGNMRAIAVTAVLYLLMHFVFAYVDMSWEAANMVYVGAMMGLINRIHYIFIYKEQKR